MENDQQIAIGRYVLHRQIARGGMATIHIARLMGDEGFSRIVAAKRLHPEYAEDPEFVEMFLDEARIASRVNHRNVVPVLDVNYNNGEVVLVQEYVHGAPLSFLLKTAYQANSHAPLPVAVSIASQVLAGLHAAHETTDEMGAPLHIIHRDVSPQNIMVATDGTARLLDFGIAKAAASSHVTKKGTFKGKLAYAAPEQIRGAATRQSDVYGLSVVLWELVVGERLWRDARTDDDMIVAIMKGNAPSIVEALAHEKSWTGAYRWNQIEALSPIIQKGLAVDPRRRWQSAAEMEEALGAALPLASGTDVAEWLKALGGEFLADRDRVIAAEEASWRASGSKIVREASVDDSMAIAAAADSQAMPADLVPVERFERTRMWVREHWSWLVAGGGLALALVLVLVAFGAQRALPPAAVVPAQPAMAPASALPAPEPYPAPPPPPYATVRPPPPHHPAPHPVSHVAPAPHTAHIAPPPRAAAATHVSPPPPTPTAIVDCNPPYYFQGDKKIFKPQCL